MEKQYLRGEPKRYIFKIIVGYAALIIIGFLLFVNFYVYGIITLPGEESSYSITLDPLKTLLKLYEKRRCQTCAEVGKNCGNWRNNCKQTLNCGTCSAGQTCSNGVCICAPNCAGKICGDNGCGGSCGSCLEGFSCDNGLCIKSSTCLPTTCTILGKTCGSWSDGCSQTLNCGSCSGNQTCTNGVCSESSFPVDYVSYYKFEADARDETGKNNGVLNGGALIVNDLIRGKVLSLDGIDDYVSIGASGIKNNSGSLTLWINPRSLANSGNTRPYIFGHTTIPAYANRIQIYLESDSTGYLNIGMGNNNTLATKVYQVPANYWNNLALTWNNGNYIFYVNGNKIKDSSYLGLLAISTDAEIGNNGGGVNTNDQVFNGLIDDVMVYSMALNSSEVLQIYNSQKPGEVPVPPCVPKTCQELGKSCGSWSDSCNETLNCGTCQSGYDCMGGTCVPQTTDCTQCSKTNIRCVDDNSGACQEYTSINLALSAASAGDTILVNSGTYKEQVQITKSGISFKGINKPIIDGEKTRDYGFYNNIDTSNIDDITIDGFEIKNQLSTGIYLHGASKERWTMKNNKIHNIVKMGIHTQGKNHLIEDNTIYMIGNDGEAMGIKLHDSTTDSIVRNNEIFLVRKEAIRDKGSRNLIEKNRLYASWTGLAYNTNSGTKAFNNYIYKTVHGFYPKHTSCTDGWNIFWHNTIYDTSDSSIQIGVNEIWPDCIDVRNNIFTKAKNTFVYEKNLNANPSMIINGNLYYREATNPKNYLELILPNFNKECLDLACIQSFNSPRDYENNGKNFNPQLINPENGNLDYQSTSQAASGSLSLTSSYGKQLGARGLSPAKYNFNFIAMTAIDASTNKADMQYSTDWFYETTWDSGSYTSNQWIIYDLGEKKSFNYILLQPYGDNVEHNVRNFRFEVSNDNANYNSIMSGINNDFGAMNIYEFNTPVTARYLKFYMIDKFPTDTKTWTLNQIRFADLMIGNLVEQ